MDITDVKLFRCDHTDDTSHKYFPRSVVQEIIKYINTTNNNVPIVLFSNGDLQHRVIPSVDIQQICGFVTYAFLDAELYLNIRIKIVDTAIGKTYKTLLGLSTLDLERTLLHLEHPMCFTYTHDKRYVNIVDGVQLHYFVCKPKKSNISYAFTM